MKSLRNLTACALLLSTSLLNAADTDSYIQDAKAYLEKGEAKSAVIQLKNALQENPTNIEARLMLGEIYLKAGDGASAEKEFSRAKDLNAASSYWEMNLARAYLMQRKYQEILDLIQTGDDAPSEEQVKRWLIRGDAHFGLRQYQDARDAYGKAGSLDPESQASMLGLILTNISDNRRNEATEGLEKLISAYPDNSTALEVRGELKLQEGEQESALADFNRAIELQPNSVRALLGRAQINLAQGELEKVRTDVATLETLVPGHPKLLQISGTVALLDKDLDKADTLLQSALNADPNNLVIQNLLGSVNYYKGNLESAHDYLSQVLKRAPNLLPTVRLMASILHKLKQFDDVVKLLEPALEQHPGDAQLMAMLGTAYMQTGRFEEGSNLMSQAIEISPDLAAYRTQLALGLMAQGKNSEAISQLENTIGMDQDFVQADVLLVLSHLREKDYAKALEASQALEKRLPDNPVGYNLTGMSYLMSGDLEQAEQRFKKALEIDPKFVTAEANLARLALQKEDTALAESHYKNVLKKSPKNATALMGLADLARRQGDSNRMHELLEQAYHGEPKTARPGMISAMAYLDEEQPLKALRMTSQLSADFPDNPAVLTLHGKAQFAAGDPINAVNTFRQVTARQKSAESLRLLANAQQAADQPDAARKSYQQALQEQPGFIPALMGLFGLELSAGNHEQALTQARLIQQALPDKAPGYEFEGTVYAVQGDTEKSIPLLEKAHQIQPSQRLTNMLARQYVQAGDAGRGLNLLRTWIEKHPDDLQTQISLGSMLLAQGEEDAAIETYEKVLQRDANQAVVLNNLAWIYSTRNDSKAMELGKQAYELAPTRPEIVDTYGWILVQRGELSEGSQILKQAAELSPKNQEIAYHLGYALHKLGKQAEAKTILNRAIALDDKSELAKSARELLEAAR
ncbi:XrtA/PEP-CTERM system TPR-repeat protein PrsT [Sedimenticola thiotaurini]|uniref:Tetratricopeptide repeat protein 21A/21B fifth ARM repeats domain-containing protein n=1 Tax=Sedimenticola thiotaurini TaxID=1543721 RepID=A0A0F7JWI7_9GAMM|nr:XrtA/PEP-CTERM system TPR-repeat protein PrsT [Sedimenticola thiotaurini]AKH19105.1 hypothetical protein AAY24_00695 [Sedimenticola thiotaurini]